MVFAVTQCVLLEKLWKNSVSLCPTSFCAKFACYSWYLLTSYFALQSAIMKRTSFFWVLVLEGLAGLHRTIQIQLLQHYWLGH